MENLENKILQQKLSELEHTLPGDYQPSLSSKWAILELALAPEKEPKKRMFLAWAAAAVFVLLAGLWWLQQPVEQKKFNGLATVPAAPVQIPEEKEKSMPVQPLASQVKRKVYPAQKRVQKINAVIVPLPVAEVIKTEQEKTITDSVQEAPQLLAARPNKKARMLEMDFNEATEPVPATMTANATPQTKLRIGIGSLARVKAKDAGQSSPVKLLTTF